MLFAAFFALAVVPAFSSQLLMAAGASSSSSSAAGPAQGGDILKVFNPCSWWWGCQTNKYDSIILNYSSYWSLPDPMLIKAEMALESGFNPSSLAWNSYCNSYDTGLMQVNPTCNNLNANKLLHPKYNVFHAAKIWSSNYETLVQRWGSGCSLKNLVMGALEMYNQGSGGAGSDCGSFPKGTQYAENVINDYYYPFCSDSNYQPRF
jgi:hypothetical protein